MMVVLHLLIIQEKFHGAYIGVLTNTTQQDSTTPSDYTWSQILGDEGIGYQTITELYYLSTSSSTAPAKPTAHVTDNTGNAGRWTTKCPNWSANKYYWVCSELLKTDGTYDWTTPINQSGLNSANSTANTANTNVNNLDIGTRNYAIGTGTVVNIIGENRDNQTGKLYNLSLTKEEINAIESDKLLISFDMEISNAITSGSANIYIGQYNSPYQRVSILETQPGKYHKEIKLSSRSWTTNVIGYRVNYINTNCTITISNLKMEIGNKYSDWNLAPEDVPTEVSVTATEKQQGTQAGIVVRLKNKDGTPLAEGEANVTMSGLVKFTDLSGSGTTTINGSNITTGTIDASQVNVTNINASNITSGNIQSSNYVADTSGTKLDLLNGTIDTKNFKVSNEGNITAKGGTIGGLNISSTGLSTTSEDEEGTYLGYLGRIYGADGIFTYIQTGTGIGNYEYPFYVKGDGTLHSSKIDITEGDIELTSTGTTYSQSSLKCKNQSGTEQGWVTSNGIGFSNMTGSPRYANISTDGIQAEDGCVMILTDEYGDTVVKGGGIWTTGQVQIAGEGYAMYGKGYGDVHTYRCEWTGSRLNFWVDLTMVGSVSDKRLKKEIKDINEDLIKAIKEIEMKQFKIDNRNGLISFGIIAQDLMEIFEKYNKNPFDYEIVQETKYKDNDDTIYYVINYEQFLVLKTKAQDIEIQKLQAKDKEKDNLIQDLLKRVEKLEKGEK